MLRLIHLNSKKVIDCVLKDDEHEVCPYYISVRSLIGILIKAGATSKHSDKVLDILFPDTHLVFQCDKVMLSLADIQTAVWIAELPSSVVHFVEAVLYKIESGYFEKEGVTYRELSKEEFSIREVAPLTWWKRLLRRIKGIVL